jgi:hypothetical protein
MSQKEEFSFEAWLVDIQKIVEREMEGVSRLLSENAPQ